MRERKDTPIEFTRGLCNSCAETGKHCWLAQYALKLQTQTNNGEIDTRQALTDLEGARNKARELNCRKVNEVNPVFPGT